MKVDIIIPGAILFTAESDHENVYSFMRLQEFYENEDSSRQGKYYSLDEMIDHYGTTKGNFSYFEDWAGFNVPGDVVDKFIELHKHDFTAKEAALFDLLAKVLEQEEDARHKGKYYIIGARSELYVDHELCHAMWHLYPAFRKDAKKALAKMPPAFVKSLNAWLIKCGYASKVLADERNAYLATSDMYTIKETLFETMSKKQRKNIPWDAIYRLVYNYWTWKAEYEREETRIKLDTDK